eukprot:m.197417 g.197417  ORF g.197417 m.197417 type:complete len:66 (-) comp21853_c1_seq2:104-301(-)
MRVCVCVCIPFLFLLSRDFVSHFFLLSRSTAFLRWLVYLSGSFHCLFGLLAWYFMGCSCCTLLGT